MESSGIVGTLGLKPDVFIAQIVNFLIILFVLWKWAYKPLLKIMDERQKKIAKGLEDAATAERKLAEIEKEHAAALQTARAEAAGVIKEATERGEKKREEMMTKAREEISKLISEARRNIADERTAATEELKKEIGALVVSTAELVLKEKIDSKKDAALMEPTVKKAGSANAKKK